MALLLAASLAVALLRHCARADPPLTGDTACKDPSTTWWNNVHGDSPCKVAELLFQQCSVENVVSKLPDDPTATDAVCSDSDLSKVSCCCNSIAYSLIEACWSCQQNLTEPTAPARRPTSRQYLQCQYTNAPGVLPSNLSAVPVPEWAFIPVRPILHSFSTN
ncbi:hypothetical protein EXIGLDRAFT_281809 [Exidia glandulosa HHB12029]|uniref:Hydrophobin n=1 Tax=Exidia glandulosa HHB12029 TaxID=1314781 RepID=A0A165DIV6_EXIGL|nr:hypothetical protein EXIGLDRAFT_281809 [Exidia glandulosa HHB12029]